MGRDSDVLRDNWDAIETSRAMGVIEQDVLKVPRVEWPMAVMLREPGQVQHFPICRSIKEEGADISGITDSPPLKLFSEPEEDVVLKFLVRLLLLAQRKIK